MDNHKFNNNKDIQNFELHVDGQRSFIEYEMQNDRVYLSHTEVPEGQSGNGIAAELVEKTFEYLESHDLKVVPGCSYVQTYLTRHPEWNRLLANQ